MTQQTKQTTPRVAAPYRMRYDLHELSPMPVDRYLQRQLERDRWAALSEWRGVDDTEQTNA